MATRYLESVLLGDDRGIISWIIRGLLWPFSVIYRIGLAAYLWLYNSGMRKRHRLSVPVVSVGNLTFGGTGKTPAVQAICRMLGERGLRVVVLSRGHGGTARGIVVASDGHKLLTTSAEVGDEPVLLSESLPGVPVIVGKDRRKSGRLACERFSPDVVVLDDGLQYWQLHRDLDVVVLDANRPFGSGHLMPMGDLREPPDGLYRADVILLVNAHSLPEQKGANLVRHLSSLAPDALIFPCARKPLRFKRVCSPSAHVDFDCGASSSFEDLDWIAGRKTYAFCGIGRPESFFSMLNEIGASVVGSKAFPDHYRLSNDDIAAIIDESGAGGAEAIITTEKDIARMDGVSVPGLYALVIKLEIEDSSRFAEYIANRIDCKNTPTATQETPA